MADASPPRRSRAPLPLPDSVALVLQGGGALGSYQAGVIEGLAAVAIEIDWVAGISIGAINAALVAGNPPEHRVNALRSFWNKLSDAMPSFPIVDNPYFREALHETSAAIVALSGVPGFFRPRMVSPLLVSPGSIAATSYYDSAPLLKTLNELIDWDLLNDGPVRLSVGAVNVESGNFHYFDTRDCRVDARHIMASGALPPGLPAVEIDGCWWWDGGLVSNTPLTHLLDHQDDEMLVFQVDLFSAAAERPQTIMDVVAREKEIRYSSRTREVSRQLIKLRQERQAIRKALKVLPAELCAHPDIVALAALAEEKPINLVHLIYRANAWEGGNRDFEFSARTMTEHWQAGHEAVNQAIANSRVVAANIETGKSAEFDLAVKPQPISPKAKD
ncbi:MAG: patatin-like phospholipase family protein [Sphingomonas sp.]|nr:patatin-like phospholipase family protein [Sphingomonas sp.]